MMKYFLLLAFIMFTKSSEMIKLQIAKDDCNEQNIIIKADGNDYIPWSKIDCISWKLFKGDFPDKFKDFEAVTYAGFYTANFNDSSENYIVIELMSVFSSNLSCYKHDGSSENLFQHEMGHFNLTEVCARMLRKELSNHVSINLNDTKDLYTELFYKYALDIGKKFADEYDKQTNFSKNIDEQKRWNKKIDSLLNAYKDYENTNVYIKKE